MASTGVSQLDGLLGGGYPDRSTVLVVGPSGVGKEALRFWFMQSGLRDGDFCLYVTKSTPEEILQDFRAFGIDTSRQPTWFARKGGDLRLNLNDLATASHQIKETLQAHSEGRIRVAVDILSSLLVLYPTDTVYRFLTQLFVDLKEYDAVLLATLEEGMHDPKVIPTMAELFDGVIEFKLYEKGFRVNPLFRVSKMRGMVPDPNYFAFSMPKGRMEIGPYAR